METPESIAAMNVSQLKSFLNLHDVNPNSVPRADGTLGQPRKADLCARALELLDQYKLMLAGATDHRKPSLVAGGAERGPLGSPLKTSQTLPKSSPSTATTEQPHGNILMKQAPVSNDRTHPTAHQNPLRTGTLRAVNEEQANNNRTHVAGSMTFGRSHPSSRRVISEEDDRSSDSDQRDDVSDDHDEHQECLEPEGPNGSSSLPYLPMAIRPELENPFQQISPSKLSGHRQSAAQWRPRTSVSSNPKPMIPRSSTLSDKQVPQEQFIATSAGHSSNTISSAHPVTPDRFNILTPKSSSKRRSSVGWLDPALIARISNNKMHAVSAVQLDDTPPPPVPDIRPEEVDEDCYVASDGDELVLTDNEARAAATAVGSHSDNDSTVQTDDEDHFENDDMFEQMRVIDLKEWLSEHKVPFISKSKKSTLVSLARAHKNHLEAMDLPISTSNRPATALSTDLTASNQSVPSETCDDRGSQRNDNLGKLYGTGSSRERAVNETKSPQVVPVTRMVSVPVQNAEPLRRRVSSKRTISAPDMDDPDRKPDPLVIDIDGQTSTGYTITDSSTQLQHKVDHSGSSVPEKPRLPKRKDIVAWSYQQSFDRFRNVTRRLSLQIARDVRINRTTIISSLVFLTVLVIFMSFVQYQRAVRLPYCPQGVTNFVNEDHGNCKPCPEHGICVDGVLRCEAGYRRVNGRCPEDQEVSLYAEHLASCAGILLGELAGRAECGESVEHVLSHLELRDALAPSFDDIDDAVADSSWADNRRRQAGRRWDRFDKSKFPPAFVRAIALLHESGAYGVLHEEEGYRAQAPRLPFPCIIRRAALRNWKALFSVLCFAVSAALILIKRRLRKNRMMRIKQICDMARASLFEQMTQYREGETPNAFIIDTHLRDEILGHSSGAVQLWKEAESLLARDTRVQKTGPVTVGGHPCYYWEWRGRASLGGVSTGSRAELGTVLEETSGRHWSLASRTSLWFLGR